MMLFISGFTDCNNNHVLDYSLCENVIVTSYDETSSTLDIMKTIPKIELQKQYPNMIFKIGDCI